MRTKRRLSLRLKGLLDSTGYRMLAEAGIVMGAAQSLRLLDLLDTRHLRARLYRQGYSFVTVGEMFGHRMPATSL